MIHVINEDDIIQTGYANVGGHAFPAIAVTRKRTIHGVAFNDATKLDMAIEFLQRARSELYGPKRKNKTKRS